MFSLRCASVSKCLFVKHLNNNAKRLYISRKRGQRFTCSMVCVILCSIGLSEAFLNLNAGGILEKGGDEMKIGFIGCGNMATAMINGILESGFAGQEEIMASGKTPATQKKIVEKLGVLCGSSNTEVAEFADILFLAVKPQYYGEVIAEIKDTIREDEIVVTIAPGKTLEWLEEQFGRKIRIIRTMPNTPAMVKEGMMALCRNEQVTEEEAELVCRLCGSFAKTEWVPEHLMDVVTSVSGSSPAYVYLFIEAMADAAVADGMPRAQAYKFAAQAVLGSAKMVLETGKHPGELKDAVCSPGGTTIEAVRVLEEKGFRSAVIEAMKACTKKSRGM